MLTYKEKDNLIYKLHPVTMLVMLGVIFFMVLFFESPIYIILLLVTSIILVISADLVNEWKRYSKLIILLSIFIVIVNAIIVQTGSTVLFVSPRLFLLGKIKITLESIVFSLVMGMKLLTIITIFCIGTYAVQPDKALKIFSKWGKKSVLIIILSTRLFPLMMNDYERITEIQKCRGLDINKGTIIEKIKKRIPLFNTVLLSSLERAFELAESMHARGYGSAKGTVYNRNIYRPRDYIIISSYGIALVIGLFTFMSNESKFNYYPKLSNINENSFIILSALFFILVVPSFLSWGWSKWQILKLKI